MKIIIFLEYFILRDTQVIDSLVPLEINIMINIIITKYSYSKNVNIHGNCIIDHDCVVF